MAPSDDQLLSSSELLQAHTLLWRCSIDYMKSMSLKCAIELGIPDVIHKHGQPIPFSKLASSLPIQPSKAHFLQRIMRILVHYGLFKAQKVDGDQTQPEELAYSLTNASRLLLTEKAPASMKWKSVGLVNVMPQLVGAFLSWSKWLRSEDENKTLFEFSEGKSFWDHLSSEEGLNSLFNDAMVNNTQLMARVVVECKEAFEKLKTLVDLGGGRGAMAKAIANAFPHVSCTVMDLPHVVADSQGTQDLKFVGGDMFSDPIPPADAILLKSVLHDWDDEDSVKILKRCREALLKNGNKEGKVIIVEMVIGNQTIDKESTEVQLLLDVFIMVMSGKERTVAEWEKLFFAAGFSNYKIIQNFGPRSVIEVYP